MKQRRICWPTPDATCLEGGCGWCNEYPFRSFKAIKKYADQAGILPNRGIEKKSAIEAFSNFNSSRNVDQRGDWDD